MFVEADNKELILFSAESNFLFHLVNHDHRSASIDDLVFLSAAVASPAFLNVHASLLLSHLTSGLFSLSSFPIHDHP